MSGNSKSVTLEGKEYYQENAWWNGFAGKPITFIKIGYEHEFTIWKND